MAFFSSQIKPWRILAAAPIVLAVGVGGLWAWHQINKAPTPNWESLRPGMTESQVNTIMGEPGRTNLQPHREGHDEWVYDAGGKEICLTLHGGGLESVHAAGHKGDPLDKYRR